MLFDGLRTKQSDLVGLLAPLRRYARSLTRDPAKADDLVHDTLVRALEAKGSLHPNTNLRTWMMTVLHNVFIDEQRRRRVEARHSDALVQMNDAVALPAQEGQVRLAQIRRAFDTLSEEQRAALHLVTLEGMAYADAAQVLGIPIGTLMSRLGRGRAALRAFEDGDDGDKHEGGKGARRPTLPPEKGRPILRVIARDGRPESVLVSRTNGPNAASPAQPGPDGAVTESAATNEVA